MLPPKEDMNIENALTHIGRLEAKLLELKNNPDFNPQIATICETECTKCKVQNWINLNNDTQNDWYSEGIRRRQPK